LGVGNIYIYKKDIRMKEWLDYRIVFEVDNKCFFLKGEVIVMNIWVPPDVFEILDLDIE